MGKRECSVKKVGSIEYISKYLLIDLFMGYLFFILIVFNLRDLSCKIEGIPKYIFFCISAAMLGKITVKIQSDCEKQVSIIRYIITIIFALLFMSLDIYVLR